MCTHTLLYYIIKQAVFQEKPPVFTKYSVNVQTLFIFLSQYLPYPVAIGNLWKHFCRYVEIQTAIFGSEGHDDLCFRGFRHTNHPQPADVPYEKNALLSDECGRCAVLCP